MTQHWYALYTRPQKERKVALALSKKGIENFCPIISTTDSKFNGKKDGFEPLLNSYVFVYMFESELHKLTSIPGVSSIVYYKSSPAVINSKELDIMKQLTATYSSIKLEKTAVDLNGTVRLVGEPVVAYGENSVSLRHQSLKIYFPSLGFTMTAERSRPKEDLIFKQSREQQSGSLLSFFPKRLNTFFFT